MIKDFEIIKKERYNGTTIEILEHVEYGEDLGFLLAKIKNKYYKIGIDGFDRIDYEHGHYSQIEV